MAGQISPDHSDWWQSLGVLLGGGGIGAVLLEVVKRTFSRQDKRDDTGIIYAERMRKDYEDLQIRYTALEERYRIREEAAEQELLKERQLNLEQFRAYTRLETENRLLRSRYHRVKGYAQVVISMVEEKLGLSGMQGIPEWIDEDVPGSTAIDKTLPPEYQDKS